MEEDAEFPSLTLVKRGLIVEALRFTEGNKTRAARILEMSRTTLWRKLREFEITEHEWRMVPKNGRIDSALLWGSVRR